MQHKYDVMSRYLDSGRSPAIARRLSLEITLCTVEDQVFAPDHILEKAKAIGFSADLTVEETHVCP